MLINFKNKLCYLNQDNEKHPYSICLRSFINDQFIIHSPLHDEDVFLVLELDSSSIKVVYKNKIGWISSCWLEYLELCEENE